MRPDRVGAPVSWPVGQNHLRRAAADRRITHPPEDADRPCALAEG
ncbi:hypothetical protein [Actinoallomurus acaciae]|uniref:Uncharacterized protein n=1 Tax=Actinoallomurus acaciae TaxID=502577 RepID=A0ABV5YI88_9ACTN